MLEQAHAQFVVGPGGEHDDGHVLHLRLAAQGRHHVVAAHQRHHHVGEYQVGMQCPGLVAAFAAIERAGDPVAGTQGAGDEFVHVGIVLDHQNQRRIVPGHGRRGDERIATRLQFFDDLAVDYFVERGRREKRRSRRRRQRQAYRKQRAAAGRPVERHAAAMQFDKVLDDGQAEAGSATDAPRPAFALAKAFEHRFAQFRRDTGPAVLDFDQRATIRCRQAQLNGSAFGGKFEGVGQQVEQNALQPFPVRLRGERLRNRDGKGDTALRGQRLEVAGGRPHEIAKVEPRPRQGHAAGLELGRVEQVGDMAVEQARVAQHDFRLVAFLRRKVGAGGTALALLERRQNQRERGAQLVADIGEKLALQRVEFQGLLVELGNLVVGCHGSRQ